MTVIKKNALPVKVQELEETEQDFDINEIFVTKRQVIVTFSQLHSGQMGEAIAGIVAEAALEDEALSDIIFDQLILDGKDSHNDGNAYYTAIFNRPDVAEVEYEDLGTEEVEAKKRPSRKKKEKPAGPEPL